MGLTLAKPTEAPDSSRMMGRIFALLWLCLAGLPVRADTIVFAAASLKEPLDALAAAHDDVVISYGGSGTMARQVMQGAPADIVLLANTAWMDVLSENGAIDPATIADLASNRLVMIGGLGAPDVPLDQKALGAALAEGPIALGLTDAVPAGIYAKSALENLDLWEQIAGNVAEVDNVRAALALVARGQAPLGIVYATDAQASDAVRIVADIPPSAHAVIRYQAAMTQGADPAASSFWDLLTGPEGQKAFANAGFLPAVRDRS